MKKLSALLTKVKRLRIYAVHIQKKFFLHTYSITCLKKDTLFLLKVIQLALVILNARYLELCSVSNNLSSSLITQITLFSTPTSTIVATVPGKMSKDSKINLFLFFCLIESFDLIFLSLEYSIKFLVEYNFTENHGAFETTSYQQSYGWKALKDREKGISLHGLAQCHVTYFFWKL